MRDLGLSKGTWPWPSERNRQAAIMLRETEPRSWAEQAAAAWLASQSRNPTWLGKRIWSQDLFQGLWNLWAPVLIPQLFLFFSILFIFIFIFSLFPPDCGLSRCSQTSCGVRSPCWYYEHCVYPAVPVGCPSAVSYLRWQSAQGSLL